MRLSLTARRGWLGTMAASLLLTAACAGGPSASPTGGSPGASGSPGGQIGGSISILATWTGTEEESFRAMIQPWVDSTGVTVNYQGTRDMGTILSNAIQAGGAGLPDVAGVPGPGEAAQ